jgi:AcrR family transcriptional regulator
MPAGGKQVRGDGNGNGNGDGSRALTRQGQERKQQLLDRAAELFAERGYAETRVIDIVRAAGVAKGLFYWYFDNKEALYRELVESTRHKLRLEQANAIDVQADPLTRLRQGVEASIRFAADQRRLYALFEMDGVDPRTTESLRAGSRVHTSDTSRHIAEGIAAGLIRDEDPRLLALGVVATVGSFTNLHRLGRIDVPIDDLATFTGRFVVRALAASDDIADRAMGLAVTP